MWEKYLNQFKRINEDYILKTFFSSAFTTLVALAFAFGNGILGIVYGSVWNGSICVYYLLLAGIRGAIVYSQRTEDARNPEIGADFRRRISRNTHIMLLIMNLSLFAPAALMVKGRRDFAFGLIPALGMAAYTFWCITMSIVQYRRAKRSDNVLVSELRLINLIDSLVALLTLQNTLICVEGGMNSGMQTVTAGSSAIVLLIIVILTLRSFVKSQKV